MSTSHRMSQRLAIAALVTAASLWGAPALAHGNSAHAASSVKEQKPWGIGGDAKAVTRTITLRMSDDMRFTPNRFSVKQGETVRLRVVNQGQVMHELVLGTADTLDAHAKLMLKFPEMEHDEPYMAHVKPGQTGELVWAFNRPGSFDFACLIAGHFQAGMTGTFTVMP